MDSGSMGVIGALAGALLVGVIVWVFMAVELVRERRLRIKREELEDRPICGCGHHFSFHDDAGCHYVTITEYGRDKYACGCKRYVGPQALELMP